MSNISNFVTIDNTKYYKISNSEKLAPFFIQVPSSSDIWIFLSSNGGVTAGRKNAEGNIFPYDTDDKLGFDYETGSKTLIKINNHLWQPFEQNGVQKYNISRNIYKSYYANSVIMEEVNHDLNLTYSYKYESSEKYGMVKTSKITNQGKDNVKLEILDGLMNIMPYGVNQTLQATGSTLVDSYKAAELVGENLAVFSLTTQINDTPHPIEMLKANVAYHTSDCKNVYLNPAVIKLFATGQELNVDRENYGGKCGYFIVYEQELECNEAHSYSFVLDNGYDHMKIAEIEEVVVTGDYTDLYQDIAKGTEDIIAIVEKADGIQKSGDEIACAAHYLNTLYNCMRGGIFEAGYSFDFEDFYKFISVRNKASVKNLELLAKIKECKDVNELKLVAKEDDVLYRLALEYMPLSFSRRHGDPSRPWNKFNITIKDEEGNKTINYEGNWRDIFQNWEALALSYPSYFENMVAKFVNASTFDGYNPYRINTQGIDWEKPEPENPFSGLGYWGDHQIIYLLRLLQGLKNHFPTKLKEMLSLEIFSYANVPYVISDYNKILEDSKSTIYFDFEKDEEIESIVSEMGSDGRLLLDNSDVITVSLGEKLMVPVLSKISNLLAGGGIWMNTQRPEWNDANNAIVGIGLSMVTTYHVSAYLDFLLETFKDGANSYQVSEAVVTWLTESKSILSRYENNYKGNEKSMLDEMGNTFSAYRTKVYANGIGSKVVVDKTEFIGWLLSAKKAVDYTIQQNKGDVYASYNLLKDDFTCEPMKPMLEGQSAAIGSGFLSAKEVCDLVGTIKKDLYSEKLRCHTLYPVVKTKRFFDKNCITLPIKPIEGIVIQDVKGRLHFHPSLKTEELLLEKCNELRIPEETVLQLVDEYEKLFSHKKFNGRSEVMYKFEGIGCAYWHQNAKFTLAILETAQKAKENGEDITEIYKVYNEILQGFIYRKTPSECGAIPIEPYSHTSYSGKSEQPGMTGQVKESIIMRRGELGVRVKEGVISFDPSFLRQAEFDENGEVSFALCGIPVWYKKSDTEKMIISFNNGEQYESSNYVIDFETSKSIFEREDVVKSIVISI